MTVSDDGRSRCTDACQLCAEPTRNAGSTANVLSGDDDSCRNPVASVSGKAAEVCAVAVFESGGCCASSIAIDWYTD